MFHRDPEPIIVRQTDQAADGCFRKSAGRSAVVPLNDLFCLREIVSRLPRGCILSGKALAFVFLFFQQPVASAIPLSYFSNDPMRRRNDSLISEPDSPAELSAFSRAGWKRRRRSLVQAWGGWPRVVRWLALLFALSLSYDFGLFSSLLNSPTAAAAPASEKNGEADLGLKPASKQEAEHGHENPVTPVLVAIVMILFLAKVGGDLFERLGMPAVLGELSVGIVLGNVAVFNPYFQVPEVPKHVSPEMVERIEHAQPEDVFYQPGAIIKILAEIGVVLLLFEVGLESTVHEMLSVGMSSLLVAVLGVIAPMLLGWLAGWLLVRELGSEVHAFIGATLCATSVGITARVLKDLGRSKQRESQIILGAAVIDDVLGLVILTVVTGVISSGAFHYSTVGLVVFKAAVFLFGAVFLGAFFFTRPLFKAATFLRGHGLLVCVSLVICFGFAYVATLVQLEPIVGAFAAGLILERTHYRELGEKENHHDLEEALAPISALLVPIFFVQMGTQVKLSSFADSSVWGLAAAITVMAILGKQICALGVREKGLNRLAVGLGMIPRGEVGLIFAGVGKSLKMHGKPVIDDNTFSAIVVMVMITTMVTPPLLKWSMTRKQENPNDQAPMTNDN